MNTGTNMDVLWGLLIVAVAGLVILNTIHFLQPVSGRKKRAEGDGRNPFWDAFLKSNLKVANTVLGILTSVLLGMILNGYLRGDISSVPPAPTETPAVEKAAPDKTREPQSWKTSTPGPDEPEPRGTGGGPEEEQQPLTSLVQTETNDYIRITDSRYIRDNYDNLYPFGKVICCKDDGWSSGKGLVEYFLNGGYKTLTGTIFVPYESRSVTDEPPSLFRIYGDGKLLYNGPSLEGKTKPAAFAVNVENVQYLTLMIHGGWYKGDGTGLIPLICAGNLTLSSKTVPKDSSLPKVYLSELEPYEEQDIYVSHVNNYYTDITGHKYYQYGIVANRERTGFYEYRLDGKYKTLKGTLYIPRVSIGQSSLEEPRVDIYADDALKKTIVLGSKDPPQAFSLDVSGVEFLKITVSGGWYRGDGTGLIPAICVGDPCLY